MKLARYLVCLGQVAVCAASSAQTLSLHMDVEIRTSAGPVAGSQLGLRFFGDTNLLINGQPTFDYGNGRGIWPANFGDLPGGPYSTDDPGFQAFAGTLLNAERLFYRPLDTLLHWTPQGQSWNAAPAGTSIRIEGTVPSDIAINALVFNDPAALKLYEYYATPTFITGTGVLGPTSKLIDEARPNGSFHTHLNWFLESTAGAGTQPIGAYLLSLQIFDATGKYTDSPAFYVLFNNGLTDADYERAFLSRIMAPAGTPPVAEPPPAATPAFTAASDIDLTPLGSPAALSAMSLRATASFTTARSFVIGPEPAIIDTNGYDLGISGDVMAAARLEKTGAGTLTLSGANIWLIAPVVKQGVLKGTAASLQTPIESAGTVEFAQTVDGTYAHVLSGTGGLRKSGSATLYLSGANTYTGGTVIDDGVLIGDHRSLQGAIVNNAALGFHQTTDGTYAGILSGSGVLLKYGPGNLTLAGINTHAGGITFSGPLTISDDRNLGAGSGGVIIDGGSLHITANVATARNFGLGSGGAVFDTGTHALTINGVISGPGALAKLGPGTLTLTGSNTYSGPTTVSAGTLVLRGSLAGPVSVAAGAALEGDGTMGGHLQLASGARLRVHTDPSGRTDGLRASSANVQGAAVEIVAQGGDYPLRTRHAILSAAGGVSGRFTGASSNLAFLQPALDYDAHNVYLTLARNDASFQSVARTPAQLGVATALGGLSKLTGGDAQAVVGALEALTPDAAREAFDAIGGAGRLSIAAVQQSGQRVLTQQAVARLGLADAGTGGGPGLALNSVKLAFDERIAADARPVYAAALAGAGIEADAATTRHGFWLRGYGGSGQLDGAAGASGASFDFSGIIAGYDRVLDAHLRLGVLASYAKPKLTQSLPASNTRGETRQLALYGRYRDGALRVDALAGIADNDTSTLRQVTVGGLRRVASAAYGGKTASVYVETGYRAGRSVAFEPIVSLQWSRQRDEAYTETGAGALDLAVAGRSLDSLRATLGVRAARDFVLNDVQGTLEARVAWAHEFRGPGSVSARLAADTSGTAFSIPSLDVPRDSALVGVGASVLSARNFQLYADLAMELSAGQRMHSLGLGLRYLW